MQDQSPGKAERVFFSPFVGAEIDDGNFSVGCRELLISFGEIIQRSVQVVMRRSYGILVGFFSSFVSGARPVRPCLVINNIRNYVQSVTSENVDKASYFHVQRDCRAHRPNNAENFYIA